MEARKTYHHGDLENDCSTEALRILKKKGPDGLSLREISRNLGVSPGAPYRHFKSKEELLAKLAANGFEKLFAEISKKLGPEGGIGLPVPELYALIGEAYLHFAIKNSSLYWLMFGRISIDRDKFEFMRETEVQAFEKLKGILALDQASTVFAWSSIHGFVSLMLDQKLAIHGISEKDCKRLVKEMAFGIASGFANARSQRTTT